MAAPQLSSTLLLAVPMAPLLGAVLAGFFGKAIGRAGAHRATILGVLLSFVLSAMVLNDVLAGARFNATVYEWMVLADPAAPGGVSTAATTSTWAWPEFSGVLPTVETMVASAAASPRRRHATISSQISGVASGPGAGAPSRGVPGLQSLTRTESWKAFKPGSTRAA